MEKLKYIVENYVKQAESIKKEYPQIDCIIYKIEECGYEELRHLGFENNRKIEISNGVGKFSLLKGDAFIQFSTKPLIVSEPIIVEG